MLRTLSAGYLCFLKRLPITNIALFAGLSLFSVIRSPRKAEKRMRIAVYRTGGKVLPVRQNEAPYRRSEANPVAYLGEYSQNEPALSVS